MLVLVAIEIAWCHAIGFWGNDNLGVHLPDRDDQSVCVKGFIGNDRFRRDALDQRLGLRQIVCLSGRQRPSRELSEPFNKAVNFGGQPTARAPERLIAVFFGAPAACWWALTMVESRKTSSKSASLANSAKTRCQTPRSDQRAKRLYALFQGPKRSGKSRHGEPVRATHSTASTNNRLS